MNAKLLQTFLKMSKYAFYCMILQSSLYSFALSHTSGAQTKMLSEIELRVSLDEATLPVAFDKINRETGFTFAYIGQDLPDSRITVDSKKRTLEDLLMIISNSSGVAFRRVNETIHVRKATEGSNKIEEIIDEIQPIEINGKVLDETGSGLPGATVVEKGTTNGTITDIDGNFSLDIDNASSVVLVSFVGYSPKEVSLNGRTTFEVSLEPDLTSLQEVVVVGYGSQNKATLTGSVAEIKGEELTKSPSVNVTSNLAGRLPGLIVNQSSGTPGDEDLDILIRGSSSFNDNSPLIVIDGVPRDNLQRLNPQDIESISVLKDATAAIYGARAANGVILVTTKQGSRAKPSFNISYNFGLTEPTKIPDAMDAALFATVNTEAEWYRAGRPSDLSGFNPTYSDAAIQAYRDGSDPVLYPNTDWPAATTKRFATQQRMNLGASGGSDNIRYLLSLGITDQEGNYRNNPTQYRQYNTRIRVDADLTEDLTVGANINGIINTRTSGRGTDFVGLLQSNPTLPAVYPNGLIAPGRFRDNPLLSDRRGYNRTNDYPIYTTFTAEYSVPFVEGLKLTASYNYDLRNEFRKVFDKPHYWHEYNVNTGNYDRIENQEPVTLEDRYRKWSTTLFNFRINYGVTIAQSHNLTFMIGAEQQSSDYNYVRAYRQNFVSSAIPQIDAGSADPDDQQNGGSASETAYNNYFGRLNYDFKAKYLLEFVFRYDGSQKFPEGNRYGFFPAVSAGWRISEEAFFNVPAISQLKLRGSYGELGNDRVDQWQYLQAFEFGNNYVFGGTDFPGIFSSRLPNTNITWEVSKKLDVGLDATLWNGLLGVDFTYFMEKRSEILLPRNLSVANIFGFPELPDQNFGEVNNSGFELILTHRNNVGDLTYSLSANTSYAQSEIVFMDETPPNEEYASQTGRPLGAGLYYKSDGIFNTQEELDGYPHQSAQQVGDVKIVDLNDDGVINGDDRYRTYASPTPQFVFGLSSNFQYRGFDLTLFFQGQAKGFTYDGALTELGEPDLDNNLVYRAEDRWTVDNQEGATMPRADLWEPGTTDFFLYDATFIRLKNLELGYNFGDLLSGVDGIKSVRLFVSGTNLATWSKEITWRDPEIRGSFTEYPPLRILNFGINVGL